MNNNKLKLIKFAHTLIWGFMVTVIFYLLYRGIYNRINILTWISIGIIFGEGIVLLAFKMYCPLTIIARKYSNLDKDNFDIYLPNWLAKYNKQIFTTIFLIGFLMVIYRLL